MEHKQEEVEKLMADIQQFSLNIQKTIEELESIICPTKAPATKPKLNLGLRKRTSGGSTDTS